MFYRARYMKVTLFVKRFRGAARSQSHILVATTQIDE